MDALGHEMHDRSGSLSVQPVELPDRTLGPRDSEHVSRTA
jgi:hypothetical protein